MSKLEHQMQLEKLFNKNQLMPRMRKEFEECDTLDFAAFAKSINIDLAFVIDAMVQMALHKRADLPTMVGTLRHHCGTAQQVADNLLKMAEEDAFHFDPTIDKFIVIYGISEDVQHELDSYQYPLPMVVEPKTLTNNYGTGYFTSKGSVILKKNHTDDDICLDHLNRMNKIPLAINWDVARMIKNDWSNLDKPKEGETHKEYEKRVRAFKKYDRTAHEVMGLLTQEGNRFFLTHRPDKRGRTYCQGYHVSYQGTSWNKATLEFADKEYIDD
jgi:hypothetical protein